MTFENVGLLDRLIRLAAGIGLEYAAFVTWPTSVMSQTGALSIGLMVVGAIALASGFMGWCGIYTLLGISTNKEVGA